MEIRSAHAHAREIISIWPAESVESAKRLEPHRFKLMVPSHWRPARALNQHAEYVENATLAWFHELGCTEDEILKVRAFKPSHYVGMPFPFAGKREALLLSKFLSLWLLWDDVAIERGENGWKLDARHVLLGEPPADASRFDIAWLSLLKELGEAMSPAWIDALCQSMAAWSDAALAEARMAARWKDGGARVSFAQTSRSRSDTIGMEATAYLVEYASGVELPQSFHKHATVKAIKACASTIVGLGNDLWSAGKDYSCGYINVLFALQSELAITTADAMACVIRLHNEAMVELDALASSLPSWGPAWDEGIDRWVESLRYSLLGFSVWESEAPRYSRFKLLVNDQALEPSFAYYNPEHPSVGALLRAGAY